MRAPSTVANWSTTAEAWAIVVGVATDAGVATVVGVATDAGVATVVRVAAGAVVGAIEIEVSWAALGPVAHAASVPTSARPQSAGTNELGLKRFEGVAAPGSSFWLRWRFLAFFDHHQLGVRNPHPRATECGRNPPGPELCGTPLP